MTKLSDCIVQTLTDHGVTHAFTLPGGFSMHLNDSFGHSQIQTVYCLHESGAGFAACGYAAYTGKLAVCVVTSGPGCTNALTACASAWQDNLPVLFISGDAKVPNIKMRHEYQLRQGGQQDVPIMEMVRPITKGAFQPENAGECMGWLRMMVRDAITPRRGPCWLSVPLDVQAVEL